MSTAAQEPAVSPEALLQQMRQLDGPSLDQLLDQARLVQAERRAPHLSEMETELLLKINTPLDEQTWKRYTKLYAKLRPNTLTEAEHTELLQLIDIVEITNAKRIEHLIQLASLRGTSLASLMKTLGIGPRSHG